MNLLLDTVTFLDSALAPQDISARAKALIVDPENDLYISTVSFWEVAIKYSIGKLALPESPESFLRKIREKLGAALLPLDEESALHVVRLPMLHRDPFDRILICQAMVNGMVFLTSDSRISQYPVRTAW
jgi:PIN domain nuclease of toxin-antitoxin system